MYKTNIFEHKRSKKNKQFLQSAEESCVEKNKSLKVKKRKVTKKVKVLLKVIQRMYDIKPEIQELIDASMIEVCALEGVSPDQILFISLLLSLSQRLFKKKNQTKSVKDINNSKCKFWWLHKKKEIFSSNYVGAQFSGKLYFIYIYMYIYIFFLGGEGGGGGVE